MRAAYRTDPHPENETAAESFSLSAAGIPSQVTVLALECSPLFVRHQRQRLDAHEVGLFEP